MKSLYECLRDCKKEEEVKSEFCKFFKMKINALRGIDHYTERILFEFKFDRNFKVAENIARTLAQVMYYARLLKYGAGLTRYTSWMDWKIETWDVGIYQIRQALKAAGIATEELAALKDAHDRLREKLLPKIYEYGFLNADVACEGGWGINTYYSVNPLWYMYQYGFTGKAKNDLTREDAITKPLFTPFRSENAVMHSTNLFTIADTTYREQLRAKFLADAIPATSFAAGANFTGGGLKNHNMHDDMPWDGWPRDQFEWLHSDIKDVSYFYVYKLFNCILQGGTPNAP